MGSSRGNRRSLARSLGEFVGHIRAGIRAKPGAERDNAPSVKRREVSRTVDEETVDTPRGRVTLRRTVIEEVDLPTDDDRAAG